MDDLNDLINDLPEALRDDSAAGGAPATVVEEPAEEEPETPEDAEVEEPAAGEGEEEEPAEEEPETPEDDQSEYIVDVDEEEPVTPAPTSDVDTSKQTQDEYVLAGLQKLTVRVLDQEGKVHTVQAYGNGDLPRDMKEFASKYEEKMWDSQVMQQEAKARELIQKYQNSRTMNEAKAAQEQWATRENIAIREDLNDLIKETLFPHFKGQPGTREFESSPGGKEFQRVLDFMNERNAKYNEAGNKGRAYRHIGFREAYDMLNGPNPKAGEKAEQVERKKVAKKLKSGGGTKSDKANINTAPVSNLNDLVPEFEAFVGSTK